MQGIDIHWTQLLQTSPSAIARKASIHAGCSRSAGPTKEAEGKSIETLETEARKQQIVMDFQAHQARVAQEISIAQRIASSLEVEIEEYYDTSGKGSAGLKAEEKSVTLGLSGEGRKVTKRIIKFKGGDISADAAQSENA